MKAIFLDRDGTINVEKQYLHKIEDFEFLPGVLDGLKILSDAGYLLIVITNQSGIARGYYTEQDFHRLNNWMVSELRNNGIEITRVYYCPHLPDATVANYRRDCDCRKPGLGLYMQAVNDYGLTLENCYAIGDKIRDCSICESTLCKGFLIGENEETEIIEKVIKGEIQRVKYRKNLFSCAYEIANGLLNGSCTHL